VCGVIINEEADPILFHNNKKTNIGNWHPSAFFLSLHILLSLSKQNNARNSLRSVIQTELVGADGNCG
ncbi:hypothetical protein CUMW_183010, partial [Citrus unshiu]